MRRSRDRNFSICESVYSLRGYWSGGVQFARSLKKGAGSVGVRKVAEVVQVVAAVNQVAQSLAAY